MDGLGYDEVRSTLGTDVNPADPDPARRTGTEQQRLALGPARPTAIAIGEAPIARPGSSGCREHSRPARGRAVCAFARISPMSGHSKWASIKHKKAATDAKRGKLFTKLARAITVAAREGGGDPDANPTLAAAVQKAQGYSMPKDNIQRAIDRGTGAGAGAEQIERVVYEGYGPGGAAILVEALTDNRNRTGPEIRHAFDKTAAASASRARSPGVREERRRPRRRRALRRGRPDRRVDAGADDVAADGDLLKVTSDPADLAAVREALEEPGVEVESAELAMEPKTSSRSPTRPRPGALIRLIEALDDHDDVDAVHANFDIPARAARRGEAAA